MVNDGSKDDTAEIVESYITNDSRIKLVNQQNAGAFAARLTGVAHSTSPWVCFIDSDDTVDEAYLEKLHELARIDTDIVISMPKNLKLSQTAISIDEYRFKTIIGYPIQPSMYAKLYRRSLFSGVDHYLPREIRLGEDLIMNIRLAFQSTQMIMVHPEYHYSYRHGINRDSVTRVFNFSPEYYQLLSDYVLASIPSHSQEKYRYAELQCRIGNLELFCGYKVNVPDKWWKSELRYGIIRDLDSFGRDIPLIHRLLLKYRHPLLRRPLIFMRKVSNKIRAIKRKGAEGRMKM